MSEEGAQRVLDSLRQVLAGTVATELQLLQRNVTSILIVRLHALPLLPLIVTAWRDSTAYCQMLRLAYGSTACTADAPCACHAVYTLLLLLLDRSAAVASHAPAAAISCHG
jgi:hypothetical protein